MEVLLLSGGTVRLRLDNKKIRAKEKSKSKLQYKIGQQLKKLYPHDQIFEEVYIPVENLVFDFFLPSLRLVIECNGRQHSEHVKFFHRTRRDFHNQNDRDQRKRDLCKLNGFRLIEVCDE